MPGNFPLHLLPSMASYLGADISAGIHAMGMTLDPAPVLLVDLGTNGEIVLSANGRLFGCATAAGPAFEGGGLSGLDFETIGDPVMPTGICGSAYVDFLATARTGGLLMDNGRMDRDHWESLPDCLKLRGDDGLAIRIGADNPVSISEVDIAHLLQAKAAIAAGIEILLETSGIPAADIQRVELAGGFGMHVDVAHAIAIGMLPGLHPSQIRVVGNTSLAGALIALLDRSALDAMEHFREEIEVLELNLQPDFEDCYINHLFLP
ncbi:MAG: ATP-binding protein [Akkermansiaceae bacterium]|nr:ATP-binding protein [Akkermansiaceae bacterium]